ncbi:MAG: LPS-assembly protein LptD [Luminiphilus sp.]|nr:LPS-assembly protein LptD [Luminiphilus sp.]
MYELLNPKNLSGLTQRLIGAALLVMSASPFAHASQTIEEERIQARLNWVPLALVKNEYRDERCLKCRGRYEDPLADADRSTPPNQSDLEVSAGDSDITDDTLYFSDDVTVSQGYRTLKAQEVIIDRVEQTVSAEGPIEVREPGIVMYGDRITYDSLSERAWLSDTEFVMYEQQLYGIAERVTRDANGSLEIEDGQLTFCAPTDPSWLVTAETLRVDPTTNTGEAWGARIDIKGVPVAYLPWVQFPLNDRRKTGLLFPDISSDTRGGLDITAPIYLNLAPNFDATYSPRLIQDRGLVHQLNTRFLGKRTGFWDVSGTYLRDDDLDASDSDNNRWLVNVQQSSDPSARLRTSIDLTKVSDNEYLRDLENNTPSAQRQTALLQRARVDWLADSWLFGLEAQQFQSIAEDLTDNYRRLPQISAVWRGDAKIGPLEPVLKLQAANFDTDLEKVKGQRVYQEVGVTLPLTRDYGFLNSSLMHRSIQYRLKAPDNNQTQSESVSSWLGRIEGGLEFERSTELFGLPFTQTLEPRFQYLYAGYDDHAGIPDFDSAELTFSYRQLFRNTRFSGYDRLADANQLSVGLTSRLIDTATGKERVSASFGQVINFRDQRVRLKESDAALTDEGSELAFALNVRTSERWSIHSNLLFDSYEEKLDATNIRVGFRPNKDAIINLGYTLREPPASFAARPVTEQINTSAYMPINDNWSAFGAVRYSLEIGSSVEDMIGVEYDGCCWRVRLIYMSYLDALRDVDMLIPEPELTRDRALQFQFVLKGLGGFGNRVDNLMQDMIRGFNAKR